MKGLHDPTYADAVRKYEAEQASAKAKAAKAATPPPATEPEPEPEPKGADGGAGDLSGLKVTGLRKLAAAAGVKGYRSMSKSQLLNALG